MKWYIAITTAPRIDCTLQQCIDSIRIAGWDDINIFAEPGSTHTSERTYNNFQRLGTWRNWTNSVVHALESDAEYIMTVQDDSLFHPDSKDFSEYALPLLPSDAGFLSLYTPKHYTIRKDGSYREPGINRIWTKSLWGACALIFPRHVLEEFSQHKLFTTWLGAPPRSRNPEVLEKRKQNPEMIANSDTAIGKFMNWTNKTMWFVDPSPVQHISKYSTIGHGDNTGRRNCIRPADHSLPLKEQVYATNNIALSQEP